MWRLWVLTAVAAAAQSDPVFERVPFEDWLKKPDASRMHWSLRVPAPFLSESQRLDASVIATIEGSEVARRPGRMVYYLEIRDRDGRAYRAHRPIRSSINPSDPAAGHVARADLPRSGRLRNRRGAVRHGIDRT